MTPIATHISYIANTLRSAATSAQHKLRVHHAKALLMHHQDQLELAHEASDVALDCIEWHTRQAAIARAELHTLEAAAARHAAAAALAASAQQSTAVIDGQTTPNDDGDCTAPRWATPRLTAIAIAASGSITLAALWHVVSLAAQSV